MAFKEWIFQEYVKWQAAEGQPRTVTDFAAYLGVAHPAMQAWMKGRYKPKSVLNVAKLADKLGLEVYEVLGMPRSKKAQLEEGIVWIARAMAELPQEWREPVVQVLREVIAEPGEPPGDEEILRRIMEKAQAQPNPG